MSFIKRDENAGTSYAPGYFLANNEDCTRLTKTIKADDAAVKTATNGGKYMPMGTTYKADGAVAGVVYEDVDVTFGDMPGSVVTHGTIYKDRLVTPDDADALKALGFIILDEPTVTRPDGFEPDTEETTEATTTEGDSSSTGGTN